MIYVFKTSVETEEAVKQIRTFLDKVLEESTWNFDVDDCDHILRIDSETEIKKKVCDLLNAHGFECHELCD